MPTAPPLTAPRPTRGVVLGSLAYLGGLGLLAMAALRALVAPRGDATPFWSAVVRHLDRHLGWGLLLVALVLAPLGSFLAMQAYFSATFREASGAVVGLGLARNLAPLLSGFILAALLAARIVPELRHRPRLGLDEEPGWAPDRDLSRGLRSDQRDEPDPARLAAVRIVAAGITGPVLAFWGTVVGFLMGMMAAQSLLSVSPGIFVNKCLEMIEPGDLIGLVVKSVLFALAAALLACHEGLRENDHPARARRRLPGRGAGDRGDPADQ